MSWIVKTTKVIEEETTMDTLKRSQLLIFNNFSQQDSNGKQSGNTLKRMEKSRCMCWVFKAYSSSGPGNRKSACS